MYALVREPSVNLSQSRPEPVERTREVGALCRRRVERPRVDTGESAGDTLSGSAYLILSHDVILSHGFGARDVPRQFWVAVSEIAHRLHCTAT